METYSLIIEILVVGLLIAAVVTIIEYPKDIIRGFFNFFKPELLRFRSWIFLPFWIVGRLIEVTTKFEIYDHEDEDEDLSEKPYKSTKNLKFNFGQGTKYITSNIETEKITEIIKSFLHFSYANIAFDDFIVEQSAPTIIKCPNNISFHDFNLLVQHSNNELGSAESYGLFKSSALSFYCYQDPTTTHNIIGRTNSGQKFSVYTLDDLNKKIYLRLNDQIDVVEEMDINVKNSML